MKTKNSTLMNILLKKITVTISCLLIFEQQWAQNCTNAVSLPYFENFQGQTSTALPACFVNELLRPVLGFPPQNEWQTFTEAGGNKYAKLIVQPPNGDSQSEIWFYLPKMYFEVNKTYKLSFQYKSSTTTFPGAPFLKIAYDSCSNSSCMNNYLTISSIDNTSFLSGSLNFAVATSANYYIGFKEEDYPNHPANWLAIDSIVVQDFSTVPVSMSPLNYIANNTTTSLLWQTYTEQNNKGFEIEQSNNGTQFQRIDFVASNAPNGNSVAMVLYNYIIPANRLNQGNYFRIKQLDKDGGVAFSNIITVANGGSTQQAVVTIKGNPVNNILNFSINQSVAKIIIVSIIDVTGRKVLNKTKQVNMGSNTLSENIQSLTAGKYYLSVTDKEGKLLQAPVAFSKL